MIKESPFRFNYDPEEDNNLSPESDPNFLIQGLASLSSNSNP